MTEKTKPTWADALTRFWPNTQWVCQGSPTDINNYTAINGGTLPDYVSLRNKLIDLYRECVTDQLSKTCEDLISAGFISDALGTPHFYDAQVVDQINLIGSFMMVQLGTGVPYAARDMATGFKEYHVHNAEMMTTVLIAGASWKLFYLNKFHAKRVFILSVPYSEDATDQLLAVTWDSVDEAIAAPIEDSGSTNIDDSPLQ